MTRSGRGKFVIDALALPAYIAGISEAKGEEQGSGKEKIRVNMYHSQSAGTKIVRLI